MPTRYRGSETQREALNAYIKLWRAAHAVEMRANRHLLARRLTVSQFGVLEALHHLGPLSQRQLAEKILRSSGNLTLVVDNLERGGLITRVRDPRDRRVMTVSLSAAGAALVEELLPEHVDGIVDVFAALSRDELTQLAALCRKLGRSMAL